MTKKLSLVFHLNQSTVPYAAVAAASCYRPFVEYLGSDPELRVSMHVSGTLGPTLQWLEPEIMDALRKLVASGQVELLGSTLAQNIPVVCSPEVNELQLRLHREWIERVFGVSPVGFWNPERCWSEDYPALIARGGYRYTLVEEHILSTRNLSPEVAVASVAQDGNELLLVCDGEGIRNAFNASVWGNGEEDLHRLVSESRRRELVWAEDAEAIGLWGLEQGHDPAFHWERLRSVVARLKARDDIELCTLGEALHGATTQRIDTPARGQASWMSNALATPGARFYEPGYDDWFHFVDRSPQMAEQSALVEEVAQSAVYLEKTEDLTPMERVGQFAYCTRQFERGCIGVLSQGVGLTTRIRDVALFAALPTLPLGWFSQKQCAAIDDRLVWVAESDWLVFSQSGELVYWIDRSTGHQLCGNPLANTLFSQTDRVPVRVDIRQIIATFCAGGSPFELGSLEQNLSEEQRAHHESAERREQIRRRPQTPHESVHLFQHTLRPSISLEGRELSPRSVAVEFASGSPRWTFSFDGLEVFRTIRCDANELTVDDAIVSASDVAFEYSSVHSLAPGAMGIVTQGLRSLTPVDPSGPTNWSSAPRGVFNHDEGIGVLVRGGRKAHAFGQGLFEVLLRVEHATVAASSICTVSYTLEKLREIPKD